MSRRNKLLKFAQIAEFPNVYENFDVMAPRLLGQDGAECDMRGRWREAHFGNTYPITLELACGRGEYTVALANMFPQRNFIGVDVKGARIWKGAKRALEENMSNAAFLRSRIECVDAFFAHREVDEIWITFPDPFPREGQVNRRLTSPHFIAKYASVLRPGGTLHLKTDNTGLFLYSMEVLLQTEFATMTAICDDVDSSCESIPELHIQTYYERVHRQQGAKIKYLACTLGGDQDG